MLKKKKTKTTKSWDDYEMFWMFFMEAQDKFLIWRQCNARIFEILPTVLIFPIFCVPFEYLPPFLFFNILYPMKRKCPYLVSVTFNITLQKGQIEQRHLYSRQKSQTSNVDDGGQYWICLENYLIVNWFSEAWGKGGWKGQLDRNSIKLWNMKENSTWRLKAPDGQTIVDCYGQIVTQVKAKPISW